jgi:hypothetical protein
MRRRQLDFHQYRRHGYPADDFAANDVVSRRQMDDAISLHRLRYD